MQELCQIKFYFAWLQSGTKESESGAAFGVYKVD